MSVRRLRAVSRENVAHARLCVARSFSIDVHTHMYTPRYMEILTKRAEIPRVVRVNGQDRLVILPGEDEEKTTNIGRPIGREYWDVKAKIQYMDVHKIQKSVISLANPWLDFLLGDAAASAAQELNDELQSMCEASNGRLFGFATLPVRNPTAAVKEVMRLKSMNKIKGVILGTPGAGNGLDHENVRDVLHAIASEGLMVFLHPHYGVGNEHFHDSGHALFLALGFPMETTVSVSRLIVSGTLDKVANLKLLVAHAGAAMPALIGRLDSCVEHDAAICNRLQRAPSAYLKDMYFDAISYSPPSMQCLIDHVGPDRIMFGTDNPFFPPLSAVQEGSTQDVTAVTWPSTQKIYTTLESLPAETQKCILTDNAARLLQL